MKKLRINKEILSFNNIIYISNTGDDKAGDGSKEKPFKTFEKAREVSVNGDCVFFMPGIYQVNTFQNVENGVVAASLTDFVGETIKELAIIGSGLETVLEIRGSLSQYRDAGCISIKHPKSLISRLKINYYPGKAAAYSNAIFTHCEGRIKNVIIENKSNSSWSYSYYNAGEKNKPYVTNSIFISNPSSSEDYSGIPLYENCLFNRRPSKGEIKNSIVRTILPKDLEPTLNDSDLFEKGSIDILNPNNKRSHVGAFGGPFALEWSSLIGSLFKSNNNLYSYNSNTFLWDKIEDNKDLSILIEEYGMDDISHISEAQLSQLSKPIKIISKRGE